MNAFEYSLISEGERRGRRWICTNIKTLDGILVHPIIYRLYNIRLNIKISYYGCRLTYRRLKAKFERCERHNG